MGARKLEIDLDNKTIEISGDWDVDQLYESLKKYIGGEEGWIVRMKTETITLPSIQPLQPLQPRPWEPGNPLDPWVTYKSETITTSYE